MGVFVTTHVVVLHSEGSVSGNGGNGNVGGTRQEPCEKLRKKMVAEGEGRKEKERSWSRLRVYAYKSYIYIYKCIGVNHPICSWLNPRPCADMDTIS